MVKIIVSGVSGRMGSIIARLAWQEKDLELAGALEKESHQSLGRDIGELSGFGKSGIIIRSDLEGIVKEGDVVIEFTSPQATLEHLQIVARNKKAMVIGTTGFSKEQLQELENFSQNIPCLFSPNMSMGVNLLFKIVGEAAGLLGEDYDMEIVEAHHRFKKDAPSGTAKKLAQILARARNLNPEKAAVYRREGIKGERKKEEIGIHSVRAGDIVGEHTVIFGGLGESLKFIHRAHSRETFARGALRAARFIAQASPGLYSMKDVLKI
jgi:4-hydroxy-tetrahydrodipicolinate reductase